MRQLKYHDSFDLFDHVDSENKSKLDLRGAIKNYAEKFCNIRIGGLFSIKFGAKVQ